MKKGCLFLSLLFSAALCGLPAAALGEPAPLAPVYEIELSAERVYAPAPVSDEYRYTAALYDFSDEDFQNPLAESFESEGYVFSGCGRYRVKYSLLPETGAPREETVLLEITDTTGPEITLEGVYAEYYEIGDLLRPIPAVVRDNSGETIQASVSLFLGERELAAELPAEGFPISEKGNYRVVYSASDSRGNPGSYEAVFSVEDPLPEKPAEAPPANVGLILVCVLVPLALIASGLIGLFVWKRRKRV